MRKLFRIYIVVGAVFGLTQYALLDPWFSAITGALSRALPFLGTGVVRLGFLCLDTAPSDGGHLSCSDEHVQPGRRGRPGRGGGQPVRRLHVGHEPRLHVQLLERRAGCTTTACRWRRCAACSSALFGLGGGPADKLSMNMLILIGSLAYFASFVAVHLLPGRDATLAGDGANGGGARALAGPAGRFAAGDQRGRARARRRRCSPGWCCALKIDPVASVLTDVPGRLPGAQGVPGRAVTASTHRRLSRS